VPAIACRKADSVALAGSDWFSVPQPWSEKLNMTSSNIPISIVLE
jgi:hypothetical protein